MRAVALLFAVVSALLAREPWRVVRSPQFEVWTNTSERTARSTIQNLEEIRRAFTPIAGKPPALPLNVRVFVFASESEFRPFRPTPVSSGFYQSGPLRDFIALYDQGPDTARVLRHEFVHLALNHTDIYIPRWLEEGTAELYSTFSGGKLGAPIGAHLKTLQTERWMTPQELLDVTPESPYYNQRGKTGIYYAQSWALAHMLHLSPAYRENLPLFLEQAAVGFPGRAFEKAFGHSLSEALARLRTYIATPLLLREITSGPADSDRPISVSTISNLDVAFARGELLMLVGNREEAAKLYRGVAREHPKSAQAAAGLAMYALGEKRLNDARREFERAIALGANDAETWFEYAMLLREMNEERARVQQLVEKSVAANPNFAEARFLLGVRASEAGDYAAAVEHLREAVRILPKQSSFWHALAYAYRMQGKSAEARLAADRALITAVTPHQEEMARALGETIAGPARKTEGPAVRTPEAWKSGSGDRRAEGTLAEVECSGAIPRLLIEAGDRKLLLAVRNANSIAIRNAGSSNFEFRCGKQTPRRVIVEYKSAGDELTAIEFQ